MKGRLDGDDLKIGDRGSAEATAGSNCVRNLGSAGWRHVEDNGGVSQEGRPAGRLEI